MKDGIVKQGERGMLLMRAGTLAMLVVAMASGAAAQSTDAAKPDAGKAAATKPAAVKAAGGPATAATTAPGDSGLKARVESLEEQLVDMQVVVGTLESLAKGGSSSSPSFKSAVSTGGADATRVEALENQVRSLSAQVQQLNDQLRGQVGTARRSDIPPSTAPAQTAAVASPPAPTAFGSTTVTPGSDAIGGLISGNEPGTLGATPAPVQSAALPPAAGEAGSGDPKQLYETAYGYLLQRDYGAAETAFDEFLKKYPNDSLSGNAQYWLGESHFVRGQYKAAAGAFLKGYQAYAQGAKAPDSLLKLAMSLDRLGQKDAACSSFSELNVKFPNAPQSVKSRAQSERQRVGCP